MKKRKDSRSIRTTISISQQIQQKAEQIMEARTFDDFSGMLQQLIREEWERRNGATAIYSKTGGASQKKKRQEPLDQREKN